LDRLDDGAVVNHASFTDGNELYFVIDDIGVYIICISRSKLSPQTFFRKTVILNGIF